MTARASYEGMDETIDHLERGFVPQGCDQQGRVEPTIKPKRPTCSSCAGGVCLTPVACEQVDDQSLDAGIEYMLWIIAACFAFVAFGHLIAIAVENL